ncbi:(Fe-S)-binding protein [Chloroflexota bacterium]
MALEDYKNNMLRCVRCSICKWVPGAYIRSWRFAQICPSIGRYNWHTYSSGGRVESSLALLMDRIELDDNLVDIIYRCQLCGACDINCRINSDLVEPLDIMHELRLKCVGEGYILPQHAVVIEGLRSEDNMLQKPKTERGKWAEGLDVKDLTKEKAEVAFHAGCRLSCDEELWPVARAAVTLLNQAGADVGIMGKDEICCGGRAYEWGYKGELTKYAESNRDAWRVAGVKKVVVACGDGYGTLQNLYPKVLKDMDFEVLHITQYLDQLIKEGKLKLTKKVPMKVTYHDPCHLGRLGEHYLPWKGVEKRLPGPRVVWEPEKPPRHGANGVYQSPRELLKGILGLEFIEMERIREYSWCCGAGGGVLEAYSDFATFTAKERLEEAMSTGAEVLVTACPWCYRVLKDTSKELGDHLEVHDIVDLVNKAI